MVSSKLVKLASCAAWGLQLLFAVVVLALSVDRARQQWFGSAPATVTYGAFAGGFGMAVCALGIAGIFFSLIPAIVILGADALGGLFFLAGGIAYSVGLRGANCGVEMFTDTWKDMQENGLLNLGTLKKDDVTFYGYFQLNRDEEDLRGICRKALADQTLLYIAFVFALGTLFVTWWTRKKMDPKPIV